MALTSICITAYKTRVSSFALETSERRSYNMECPDATCTKPKTNIQLSMPDQKLYNVASYSTKCMPIIYTCSIIIITFVKKN